MTIDPSQNLNDLMKKAQEMQHKMQEAQQELTKVVVNGESGGGMVRIEMNGKHYVHKTKISPNLLDEDIEMLEDLVTAAINDSVSKVETAFKNKLSQLTSLLDLPK